MKGRKVPKGIAIDSINRPHIKTKLRLLADFLRFVNFPSHAENNISLSSDIVLNVSWVSF